MTPRARQPAKRFAGLNRQVIILGMVSLLADVSSEMLTPIAPLFLTTVLGASAANLGLIEGVAESLASLLKSFSGRLSDHLRLRRPFIVIGYLLTALAKPLVGISQTWPQVLGARALDRFGKGIRGAPRDALIADSVRPEEQARAFGWHRSMDTAGAIIGPLLALVLLAVVSGNLRSIYMLAFIPGLFSVALTMMVREVPQAQDAKRQVTPVARPALSNGFRKYLVVWGLFSLGNSSDAFLILRAHAVGFSTVQTILIYSVYNSIYCGASPWLGGLADRFGKKRILALGFFVFAAVYGGFAASESKTVIVVLFAIYGIYAAATDGVGKAYAVDLLNVSERAYGLGVLGTVTGIMALVASCAAGWLWDAVSPSAAFVFGATGAVFALLAFAATSRTPQVKN